MRSNFTMHLRCFLPRPPPTFACNALRANFLLCIKLCSRVAHSGGRRLGNVLYSTASMCARSSHCLAHPTKPRLCCRGSWEPPSLKSWLRPCVTSLPFQVVDLQPAPHQPPPSFILFGKFEHPKSFFCGTAKNILL